MKQKRYWALALLAIALSAVPRAGRDEEADLKALQGTWVLRTVEWLGEEAEQDDPPDEAHLLLRYRSAQAEERGLPPETDKPLASITFRSDTFAWRAWVRLFNDYSGRKHLRVTRGRFTLDARSGPKVMKRYGPGGGAPLYCIYSVEGDTLRWCLTESGDRKSLPRAFSTGTDEDVLLLTFKRQRE
jgi:uncharacterized protein (TIGR03067 family)